MTFLADDTDLSASRSSSGFWARLVQMASKRARIRQAHRQLSSLSDDLLRDIGLSRDEVDHFIRKGIEPYRHLS